MEVKVAIVDAFVDGDKGGNPAGVVLNSDNLTCDQKLSIASQVGLSETAFISQSATADFKLDFFTPQKQIAHCGHATIASFSYLSQLNLVPQTNTSKETIDGNRSIIVEDGYAYMEQLAPRYTEIDEEIPTVLAALGLSSQEVIASPIIANTGNSFILVGVKDIATLNRIDADEAMINRLSEQYDLIGFYVFTIETNISGRDASTRMFAPRYGIKEEAATGMAAGPLACYLYDYMHITRDKFAIEQGYSMPVASPSCIEVTIGLENGAITSLLAGGTGVVSRYQTVEI
ncbi:PhzF family phenazine biosynthesis protein [Vibrio sinaloensis]|uniref:PhzF family phenazine biosynthesis protein n=1 Tax=Photobacterium sp. (strain ATCC 43367) TaxID=379097 RepID=UPI0022AF43D3|nr:PhzF family phenazine biosynthesis protein [Vibrio sinaloensis]MCZ4293427.1 PhzF family phenazine biosynthesis protein [Vibrio sinaloensis]